MLQNNIGNGFGLPIYFLAGREYYDNGSKMNEDSYDVYVNNDYMGKHTLFAQNEDVTAITDFLHEQGFHNMSLEVKGDHIVVHSESEEDVQQMEKALRVFLQNR
ncbi:hypothetical protein ACERII_03865 [Evansella sp. AB-rgal1]|uniref:hypothetical protein n=1 Tax=Evansella sp. AB-rgal1 TaxID=3242696 RepID=UPI00359F0FB2